MQLNRRAKQAHKLWSIRLALAAAALGAIEATLPLWQDAVPPGVFAALSSVVGVAAAVARVIKQKGISDDV